MPDMVPALQKFREDQAPRLTLAVLAAHAGVTTGHLSRVERFGTGNLKLAMRLSALTGLPVETFAPKTLSLDEAA